MTGEGANGDGVESVRSELQRLGYLTHRVERFLLQDALKPERPLETVTLLAAKLGLLGGALIAVGGALLLLAWNPVLLRAPLDLALLVIHLFPISAFVFGLAFLLLAGVLAALLRFRPGLRIEGLSLGVGVTGGFALLGALLWRGRDELASLAPLPALLLAVGAAIAG